jgi:hypothetical protein
MEHRNRGYAPDSTRFVKAAASAMTGLSLLGGGLSLLLNSFGLTADSAQTNPLWGIVGAVFVIVGVLMICDCVKMVRPRHYVLVASNEQQAPAVPPEQLPDVQIPEGMATDLQLPWLEAIHGELESLRSPQAATLRSQVEKRIEAVKLAAIQRDLDAAIELQNEGLQALRSQRAELGLADKGEEQGRA